MEGRGVSSNQARHGLAPVRDVSSAEKVHWALGLDGGPQAVGKVAVLGEGKSGHSIHHPGDALCHSLGCGVRAQTR